MIPATLPLRKSLTIRKPCLRCVFVVGFAIYLAVALCALAFGIGYLAGFYR